MDRAGNRDETLQAENQVVQELGVVRARSRRRGKTAPALASSRPPSKRVDPVAAPCRVVGIPFSGIC